jgi:hypothetical protein
VPEVGPGPPLERFSLVLADDEVFAVVDVVDHSAATLVLTALPDFPLELTAEHARQFVAAWRQRGNLGGEAYDVREETIGL